MTSPSERQRILADLSTLAIRDLVGLWRRATRADVEFAALILAAFPEIATTYATVAGELAAAWYAEAAPKLAYQPVAAAPPAMEALSKSAQWALGADGDAALSRMSGTLQRAVFDGARRTTVANVENESGAAWARYASANACEFCRMLATRGAAYRSRATALRAHDRCHCIAVEVRPGDTYEPPPYVEQWEDQYQQARSAAADEDGAVATKDLLAAWRQL